MAAGFFAKIVDAAMQVSSIGAAASYEKRKMNLTIFKENPEPSIGVKKHLFEGRVRKMRLAFQACRVMARRFHFENMKRSIITVLKNRFTNCPNYREYNRLGFHLFLGVLRKRAGSSLDKWIEYSGKM